MADEIEVLYRPATPPDDAQAHWRGFAQGRSLLPAGSTYAPGGRALPCDIVLDRDTEVRLRDGTRIFVDVYRPVDGNPVPAILAWSPFGKQGGAWRLDDLPGRAGVPRSATSGLEKFEGPDPAFWCGHGYAVVNVDPRGSFASEGDVQMFSTQDAKDGHDAVEWAAAQDWCSGAVTMSGNGLLAIVQFMIAATRPPHLAAIAPWEGFTDVYRDFVRVGGILRPAVADQVAAWNFGHGRVEDLTAMARRHPLMNDYWRSKIIDIESIDVPAYVVASWTSTAHTRGTLDAYTRLDPARTWLRVHNSMEWPDLYEYEEDLQRFFDHAIKGKDNGWDRTPRVRLSVLDPGGEDQVNRPEETYPLARARETPLYLDARTGTMSPAAPAGPGKAEYESGSGSATFDYDVGDGLEIVGPMKLRIWLEIEEGTDADVFAWVQKTDASGMPLLAEIRPEIFHFGQSGWLRASHRELDEKASTPAAPVAAHERELPLTPGQVVPLDIAIWPYGMAWHAGQRLRVIVSGHDLAPRYLPGESVSTGVHRIRTGGPYDSHLLIPAVSSVSSASR